MILISTLFLQNKFLDLDKELKYQFITINNFNAHEKILFNNLEFIVNYVINKKSITTNFDTKNYLFEINHLIEAYLRAEEFELPSDFNNNTKLLFDLAGIDRNSGLYYFTFNREISKNYLENNISYDLNIPSGYVIGGVIVR
jgi:hypothetical protein